MIQINNYLKSLILLLCAIILTACGSGSCNTATGPVQDIHTFPNGAQLFGKTSFTIQSGESAATPYTLKGGSGTTLVSLSAVESINLNSQILNTHSLQYSCFLCGTFAPESLVVTGVGSESSSVFTLRVNPNLKPGNYVLNLYATYTNDGVTLPREQIGVLSVLVESAVTPAPTPTTTPILGTLSLTQESATIMQGESANLTVTLNNSSNVSDLLVNISSADNNVATVLPTECHLSTSINYCTIKVSGISSGNTLISASATAYATATASISVLSGKGSFLSYSLNGISGVITAESIHIILPYGSDLTNAIANFTAIGVSVSVNSVVQISGTTPNNFSTPVIYSVLGADGTTTNYTVMVTKTASFLAMPYGMALNSAKTIAYITNAFAASVSSCDIVDNQLVNCIDNGTSALFHPQGIVINASNSIAFIANQNRKIIQCSVNGKVLSNCADSGAIGLTAPTNMALSADGSILYLTDGSHITTCSVNGSTLSNCQNSVTLTSGLYGITLNKAGNILYVTNGNDDYIKACDVSGSSVVNCSDSGATLLNSPQASLLLFSADSKALISNYANYTSGVAGLVTCDVAGKVLSNCTPNSVLTLDRPIGIALNSAESTVFVANYGANSLSQCSVDLQGVVSDCNLTGFPQK